MCACCGSESWPQLRYCPPTRLTSTALPCLVLLPPLPQAGVHIVSGTPGRVFDMIKRRSLRTR